MSVSPPLAGVLVVDLSRHLPGPLTTRILADLGARVIKVEEPRTGDPVREAPPRIEGRSALAAMLLAGHESLALDLKQEGARLALETLLLSADVLVESFRPGTLARFGLAPEELRRRFPRLIVCSLSGWGQEGPHAERAGHDLTYQAIAGSLAAGQGMPAVQVADVTGAWSAAAAVLAALLRRHRDGEGAWIDQALLDAAGHAALATWAAEVGAPRAIGEKLPLTGAYPCYDLYRTSDGALLAVAALEPKFWRAFCDAVGRPDLVKRQYWVDDDTRRQVRELVASRSRSEWALFLDRHDLPIEPVLSAGESLVHPQVRERDLIRRGPDELPRLGYPARLDGERPRGGERVPELGEHTEALVEELGLAPGLSRRQRRAQGIGPRGRVRRWAQRLLAGLAERRATGRHGS